MWFKVFSLIPMIAELALMLMQPRKPIMAIVDLALRLADVAAPKAGIPKDSIRALAGWTDKAIVDQVITTEEIIELARILDVKVRINGLSQG